MHAIEKGKISYFQEVLLEWFKINARNFQWREKSLSAYEVIITEFLLQRTKAETVSRFYDSFLAKFPNWESIDIIDTEELADFLKPIGLNLQRANRIKRLAHEMVMLKGQLPLDRYSLDLLPMIGQYIGNAVELFVFGKPMPLLDVNMARLLERFFGRRKLSDIRYDPYLQKLAVDIVQHSHAKQINWAILDFAALLCRASKPHCLQCPLQKKCTYFVNVNL